MSNSPALGGPSLPGQAGNSSDPDRSALSSDLNARAVDALGRAREMPSGDQRAEAIRKAAILGNAAEILAYFAPTKERS